MDLDYFFHENDFIKIRNFLKKYSDMPAVAFPQYQFFTPDRYQLKTKICIAINKKMFPNIRLNGGGDLTLTHLNGNLIRVSDVPNINVPIYQYESTFKTKTIYQMIEQDLLEHGQDNLVIMETEVVELLIWHMKPGFQ